MEPPCSHADRGNITIAEPTALTTSGQARRTLVVRPATSGGTNVCWAALAAGSGASRTTLTIEPVTPAASSGSARIAAVLSASAPSEATAAAPASTANGTSATKSGARRWRAISSPRSTGRLSV